jgi:hypothetical protein
MSTQSTETSLDWADIIDTDDVDEIRTERPRKEDIPQRRTLYVPKCRSDKPDKSDSSDSAYSTMLTATLCKHGASCENGKCMYAHMESDNSPCKNPDCHRHFKKCGGVHDGMRCNEFKCGKHGLLCKITDCARCKKNTCHYRAKTFATPTPAATTPAATPIDTSNPIQCAKNFNLSLGDYERGLLYKMSMVLGGADPTLANNPFLAALLSGVVIESAPVPAKKVKFTNSKAKNTHSDQQPPRYPYGHQSVRDSRDNYDNRGGYDNRDNRGGYDNRDSRGGYDNRDNRGGYGNRDNRGGYGNRDNRGGYDNRDNRGGYKNDQHATNPTNRY